MPAKTGQWWLLDEIDWFASALAIQGMVMLVLLQLGAWSEVRLIVVFDWPWWAAFWAVPVVFLITCSRFATLLQQRKSSTGFWSEHPVPRRPRRPVRTAGRIILMMALMTPFAGLAIFEGLPALLHYCTRHDGEMTLTILAKQARATRPKRVCRPWLLIAEFTGRREELCPSAQLFESVAVGDRIRVQGKVSPFGIEVVRLIPPHKQ